ncbi:hypothetical protein R1flu_015137 [Riccia fluitans]|uniref:Uncharacterized protein n=1 Tax=Riccia fluitans TaxID=41844 RepID=A0ABD1YI23_9MARC
MRREGKIRGSFLRINKLDDFDFTMGNRTHGKPTNHSKVSSKCAGNTRHCSTCHAGRPWSKAMCKTKSMNKLDGRDITTNYKLEDFALKCSPSRSGPSLHDLSKYYGSFPQDIGYSYDYEYEEQETLDQLEYSHSPATRITIPSFFRGLRGDYEESVDLEAHDGYSDEENIEDLETSKGTPCMSNKLVDTDDEFDCSWSLIDSSDTEQGTVDLDGWYLID